VNSVSDGLEAVPTKPTILSSLLLDILVRGLPVRSRYSRLGSEFPPNYCRLSPLMFRNVISGVPPGPPLFASETERLKASMLVMLKRSLAFAGSQLSEMSFCRYAIRPSFS
jgi:hypothetical protein